MPPQPSISSLAAAYIDDARSHPGKAAGPSGPTTTRRQDDCSKNHHHAKRPRSTTTAIILAIGEGRIDDAAANERVPDLASRTVPRRHRATSADIRHRRRVRDLRAFARVGRQVALGANPAETAGAPATVVAAFAPLARAARLTPPIDAVCIADTLATGPPAAIIAAETAGAIGLAANDAKAADTGGTFGTSPTLATATVLTAFAPAAVRHAYRRFADPIDPALLVWSAVAAGSAAAVRTALAAIAIRRARDVLAAAVAIADLVAGTRATGAATAIRAALTAGTLWGATVRLALTRAGASMIDGARTAAAAAPIRAALTPRALAGTGRAGAGRWRPTGGIRAVGFAAIVESFGRIERTEGRGTRAIFTHAAPAVVQRDIDTEEVPARTPETVATKIIDTAHAGFDDRVATPCTFRYFAATRAADAGIVRAVDAAEVVALAPRHRILCGTATFEATIVAAFSDKDTGTGALSPRFGHDEHQARQRQASRDYAEEHSGGFRVEAVQHWEPLRNRGGTS
jgi:hypothetical protein